MSNRPITEDDLHAYVDQLLEPERRAEVMAYLDAHPDVARRVAAWSHPCSSFELPAFATKKPDSMAKKWVSRRSLCMLTSVQNSPARTAGRFQGRPGMT